MSWISPRIWRSPQSRFHEDEPLNCAGVYTSKTLEVILKQGFDAIWMRGRLRELIHSDILPELNDPRAGARIKNLQQVIADANKLGMKLFLYFNEPLALPVNHVFWQKHPELKGEPFCEPELNWDVVAFCTSTEKFKKLFRESVRNLYADLGGLGGVILITASEYHSHCWSHKARRKVGDTYIDRCLTPMQCPNCKDREPADVVAALVETWTTQAAAVSPSPQVWAWNWSWSMWYDQPQVEVIEKLPKGAKLMADFERGGARRQSIGKVFIDEYSLGYIGPSERFVGSQAAARKKGIPVCAKIQLGTTHELATVPNLPLIPNLFEKLKRIDELDIKGIMCSWNFGNSPSVNTAALKLFVERPELRSDCAAFCETLASEYFNASEPRKIASVWRKFCEAFNEFPFSIKMLYFGPMNYAAAYPLSLEYNDRPMGPSWMKHEPFGDRLEDCHEPFTLKEISQGLELMQANWQAGLSLYSQASGDERDCAEMIGLHIAAIKNIFEFHRWRREKMAEHGLVGPCVLASDETARQIMRAHIEVMQSALPLAAKHKMFGYHQEPGEYLYTPATIEKAIALTQSFV